MVGEVDACADSLERVFPGSDDYDAGLPHCVERIAAVSNPLEDVSQNQ